MCFEDYILYFVTVGFSKLLAAVAETQCQSFHAVHNGKYLRMARWRVYQTGTVIRDLTQMKLIHCGPYSDVSLVYKQHIIWTHEAEATNWNTREACLTIVAWICVYQFW